MFSFLSAGRGTPFSRNQGLLLCLPFTSCYCSPDLSGGNMSLWTPAAEGHRLAGSALSFIKAVALTGCPSAVLRGTAVNGWLFHESERLLFSLWIVRNRGVLGRNKPCRHCGSNPKTRPQLACRKLRHCSGRQRLCGRLPPEVPLTCILLQPGLGWKPSSPICLHLDFAATRTGFPCV